LNYIGRHGARFPGKEDFHYFEELRNRIVDNSVDTEFLQNWQDYPPTLLIQPSYFKHSQFHLVIRTNC
jgi:hypothetical protein